MRTHVTSHSQITPKFVHLRTGLGCLALDFVQQLRHVLLEKLVLELRILRCTRPLAETVEVELCTTSGGEKRGKRNTA